MIITSKAYGQFGPFTRVRDGLYRSPSGRVFLLGDNPVGGKGESVLLLERELGKKQVPGLSIPFTLAVSPEKRLDEAKAALREINFTPPVAIRSDSQSENRPGDVTAGEYLTAFHPLIEDRGFDQKFEAVRSSGPEMSVLVQQMVGGKWQFDENYYLPALSGMVETSSRRLVWSSIALGLGVGAVGEQGLGILSKIPIVSGAKGSYATDYRELNRLNFWCLDLRTGEVVNKLGEEAEAMFPGDFTRRLFDGIRFYQTEDRLVDFARSLEKSTGYPMEIEWSNCGEKETWVLQSRPIKKKTPAKKPTVDPQSVLLETKSFIGFGEKKSRCIIYMDDPHDGDGDYSRALKDLAEKHPKAIVFFTSSNTDSWEFAEMINKMIFPFFDVVVVLDKLAHFRAGTGLQHYARVLREKSKILLHIDGGNKSYSYFPEEKIKEERIIQVADDNDEEITIWELSAPLRIAADDDSAWAMAWFEG